MIYEPVELAQDFRSFDFMSPWEGADYVLPGDEKVTTGDGVDKPKATEKPADTGAGVKADKKAEKVQSNGSPAVKDSGEKDAKAPDQTKGGNAKKHKPEKTASKRAKTAKEDKN